MSWTRKPDCSLASQMFHDPNVYLRQKSLRSYRLPVCKVNILYDYDSTMSRLLIPRAQLYGRIGTLSCLATSRRRGK